MAEVFSMSEMLITNDLHSTPGPSRWQTKRTAELLGGSIFNPWKMGRSDGLTHQAQRALLNMLDGLYIGGGQRYAKMYNQF